MDNDILLQTASGLAEKIQAIKPAGDNLTPVMGRTSFTQAVTIARTDAAQLVFSIQNKAAKNELEARVKKVQGSLLGMQIYGVITEAELEKYMQIVDVIMSEIEKR